MNGHVDHMALVVDIVPEVIFHSCKNTFQNSYVFGISISPPQAIMALCIKRSENKWSWIPYGYRGRYGPRGHFSQIIEYIPEQLCIRNKYITVTGKNNFVYREI